VLYQVNECIFPWPDDPVDASVIVLSKPPVELMLRRALDTGLDEHTVRADQERFQRGLAGYRCIALERTDRPTPDAWMLQHRFETEDGTRFEANLAFRANGTLFALKVSGPEAAADACRAVLDSFVRTVRIFDPEQERERRAS